MLYTIARAIVRLPILAWWRPKVSGLHNIPKEGPVIIAANHLANVDSFIVPVVVPRKMRYIIKADFWHKKGLWPTVQQKFFEGIGSVPVERGSLRAAQSSLDAALTILNDGDVFAIYPEGTRSKTGKLGKAHTGVAWLEEKSGATVIPVGIHGTQHLFKKGSLLPRPRAAKLELVFGPPVDLSGIDRTAPKVHRRKAVTEAIMQDIQKLSGQERA